MRILAGTSGFAYKEWKGSFYPEDLPGTQMLRFYGENFPAVEINNTFYRMPARHVLEEWASQVPTGFQFILKASRRITHLKRLKEVAVPVAYLLETASVLGDRLGPFLFQLPPNLKQDLPRLEAFLDLIPDDTRVALEFRHESWFDDTVYDALHARNHALCIAHTEEGETPLVATADWGYLRLRNVRYDDEELDGWVTRIGAQPWDRALVFFKHEDEGTGPRLARRFLALFPAND